MPYLTSILFTSLMGVVGGIFATTTISHNPVPVDAFLIQDNSGVDWYAEPAMYYDYLILYSDTTDNAVQKIVDVYALDVDKRLLSGKRSVKFYIDDNSFTGYYYKLTLTAAEFNQYFPEK